MHVTLNLPKIELEGFLSLSSLFGLSTSTVGLDIGQHSVRVAELSKPQQHATLKSVGEALLPKKLIDKNQIIDVDALSTSIKLALDNAQPNSIKARSVVAALPETYIYTRVIQLPNLPPAEFKKAVPYEASQFLPVPIDDVYYDYIPLGVREDTGQTDLSIFAAPKSLVDGLIEAVHKSGLELFALETKPTAIARAFLPVGVDAAVLIVEIGSETTRITVADHGNVWLTTSANVGEIQLLKEIADKMQQPANEIKRYLEQNKKHINIDIISSAVKPIVNEALSAARFHETRDYHSAKITRIILAGQGTTIPELIPTAIKSLRLNCEAGKPLVTSREDIDLKYAVSLGLAMRQI